MPQSVEQVFIRCAEAIQSGLLIQRLGNRDKEFHFQNWFSDRLRETGMHFECGGRNSYPDFRLVNNTVGFELKALAYPGREADFDSNSQTPCGEHNGRTIFYVFGRYPKNPDGDSYPVLDLVICHGSFLNADHEYIHKNKSVRGFGSYGDILIRDRKMYVVPTPFRLLENVAHRQTLILPAEQKPAKHFAKAGDLCRTEAPRVLVSYAFDLRRNELRAETVSNPAAGREHRFTAWRLKEAPCEPVSLRTGSTRGEK